VVQERIAGHGGHLSNEACAVLLEELHHPGLMSVVLAHLSQRCNAPEVAHGTIAPRLAHLGFAGELVLADQEGGGTPIMVRGPAQQALFP
jgi:phosphoribosyl 1,2-cyclic phosphodiesterase